jgi:hypothetical protein
MTTKWDVLTARQAEAQALADSLARDLNGMEHTPFGKPCVACLTILETEADFARHFILSDTRYLNLGNCPMKGIWREATNEETADWLAGYSFYDIREWRETDHGLEVKVG